jgi:hypothetical protein
MTEEVKILREGVEKVSEELSESVGYGHVKILLRETLAKADAAKVMCHWTIDEWDGSWNGSCGAKWVFEDGGPSENSMKFCPQCGNPVDLPESSK